MNAIPAIRPWVPKKGAIRPQVVLGNMGLTDDVLKRRSLGLGETALADKGIHPFKPSFSDFHTLRRAAEERGGRMSVVALEYERQITGETEDSIRNRMKQLLDQMLRSAEKGVKAHGSLFHDQKGLEMYGHGDKIETVVTTFPFQSVHEFTEFLKFVIGLKKVHGDRVFWGYIPLKLNKRDLKHYRKWEFVITDPYIKAIFQRLDQIVDKLCDINPEAGFVKEMLEECNKFWRENPSCSSLPVRASAYAFAAAEWNIRNRPSVALPTAENCQITILAGVLKAMKEMFLYKNEELFTAERLTDALFTAGIVGLLINSKIWMDRKIGGCQVKIGASAAMAAAAVTDLLGGNAEDINHAVAFSLMQYEGFPCTAIGDYALTPCILRNAFGAGTAILAGTFPTNHYRDGLSPDAVMEGYIDIARKMDPSLKGAGKAGMAVSQEGLALAERLDRYNKLLKKGGERE